MQEIQVGPANLDRTVAADQWIRHMRRGEFEQAWRISDALLASRAAEQSHLARHEQSVWDGTPLDGRRVLVRCYRGLGDTLQFIRLAPQLRARAAAVIAWVQPALIPLLRSVRGIDTLLPLHEGDVEVDFDVDLEVTETPYICRVTLDTIPADTPYLHVEPADLPSSPHPKIGLVWRAGEWLPRRSIPFPLLAPLLSLPVTWYVLQGEPGLSECPRDFGHVAGTHDILELARVMRSLDLVITIDSMTAHLAGALGRRVWTLLPAEADWRWMEKRGDSPWYPTMRLFRQEREGQWAEVVERVKQELEREITYGDKE